MSEKALLESNEAMDFEFFWEVIREKIVPGSRFKKLAQPFDQAVLFLRPAIGSQGIGLHIIYTSREWVL